VNVPTEPFKINLNQNLWGLIVSFTALGLADYYNLSTLFWFALVISIVMTLSVAITVSVYTYKYCKNKI
jgi:hypothetical protein